LGSFLTSFLVGVFASALTATGLDEDLEPLLLEPLVDGSVFILVFGVSPFLRFDEDLPLEDESSFFLPFELELPC